MGLKTQGTRVDKSPHKLEPGEYSYFFSEGCWYAATPDGKLANLKKHDVTEHDDGTITVSPSILCSGGSSEGSWHGFLKEGVWEEC